MEFDSLVSHSVAKVLEHSDSHSFRSEDEIRGFLVANLKISLPARWRLIQEEPTETRYTREGYRLVEGDKGRRGRHDLVILDAEGRSARIELEYPRGKGLRDKEAFISHLKNDLLKLRGSRREGNGYLIVFAYNEPPIPYEEIDKLIEGERGAAKVAFIRLAKADEESGPHPVVLSITKPNGWLTR